MTLTELRYIVTLAQEQHFGHAAERCHVSQPTLSVGVKKLEEELGVLLFERTKSAVRVTPIGEKIVAQAQRVLEEAMTIRELANELNGYAQTMGRGNAEISNGQAGHPLGLVRFIRLNCA